MSSRKALILCGGQGTRFRPISSEPKILAKFGARLFIDWLIHFLESNGFEEIYLSCGYKAQAIQAYIEKEHCDKKIKIIIEEKALGTGGALTNFLKTFPKIEDIYVFNGDTYWSDNINEFICVTNLSKKPSLLTKRIDYNDRYGAVSLSEGNRIKFLEGSDQSVLRDSTVYIGISYLPRDIIDSTHIPPFSLEKLLSDYEGESQLIQYQGTYHDFGTPEGYENLKGLIDV